MVQGKTHAGAVLKHLLCDDVSAIEEWLREEYKLPKFEGLCQSVFDLRKKKRLFPVTLYGASSIAHPDDLSPTTSTKDTRSFNQSRTYRP